MGQQYPQLTYRGDVTAADQAQPGHVVGHDEMFRPYEVIDAEYVPPCAGCDDEPCGCDRTHINLQYATPETLKRLAATQEN